MHNPLLNLNILYILWLGRPPEIIDESSRVCVCPVCHTFEVLHLPVLYNAMKEVDNYDESPFRTLHDLLERIVCPKVLLVVNCMFGFCAHRFVLLTVNLNQEFGPETKDPADGENGRRMICMNGQCLICKYRRHELFQSALNVAPNASVTFMEYEPYKCKVVVQAM